MAEPKRYKVFYCFNALGIEVSAGLAVEMSEAEIYPALFAKLTEDGDFIGLVDGAGGTLQVLYEASDKTYWVEIPDVPKRGVHGRHFSLEEATVLFKALPEAFRVADFPSLEFQSWV